MSPLQILKAQATAQQLNMRDAQEALQAPCRNAGTSHNFSSDTKHTCAKSWQTPLLPFLGEANTLACPNISFPEHPPNLLASMKPADIPTQGLGSPEIPSERGMQVRGRAPFWEHALVQSSALFLC